MAKFLMSIIAILCFYTVAIADTGIITKESSHQVKETADRLENILQTKGMTVFKRIDHAEGAAKIGKILRPTELIIFGNPKVGTPLMQCSQGAAIDLPQKALIWEDEAGKVWLSYNEPKYLAQRHDIKGCDEVLLKIKNALNNFATKATAQ